MQRVKSVVLRRRMANNRLNGAPKRYDFLGSLVASLLDARLCGVFGLTFAHEPLTLCNRSTGIHETSEVASHVR